MSINDHLFIDRDRGGWAYTKPGLTVIYRTRGGRMLRVRVHLFIVAIFALGFIASQIW